MFAIDVRNLSVRRGGRDILSGISLGLRPGELVALLGPSGSGKSTLLKAMLGVVEPSAGTIAIRGGTSTMSVGYVPQDDVLHPSLTVEKTIRYAAELRLPPPNSDSIRAGAVTAVIAHVGLADRREVRVRNLSGGQRKRVAIAVELLAKPSLFFLDEPTSGLDPAMEEKMMQLFRTLTTPERIILVTTHVLASLDVADLAIVVAAGRLTFIGPPSEAPAFFGAADHAAMYRVLATTPAEKWAQKLHTSPYYARYVAERLRGGAAA